MHGWSPEYGLNPVLSVQVGVDWQTDGDFDRDGQRVWV